LQLLLGGSDFDVGSRDLKKSIDNYNYARQGGVTKVDGINDKSDFKNVNSALKLLGLGDHEVKTVWDMVAAILHLGNVTLTPDGEAAKIAPNSKTAVNSAAKMLHVHGTELSNALCERAIAAGGQVMKKTLTSEQAQFARDALAKAVYERLFTWLVKRINEAIKPQDMKGYKGTVIGVLDIYGFEILDTNSFEQFCINYCNEKLQQLFIGELKKYHIIVRFSVKPEKGLIWRSVDQCNIQMSTLLDFRACFKTRTRGISPRGN